MRQDHPRRERAPRGISLLEVLISIGILAIGLTAVLSLIPAGRSHMQKAAIDDRAATLIPKAQAIAQEGGMFRVDAISWVAKSASPGSSDGEPSPTTRLADGGAWSAVGGTQDHHWTISSTVSEVITDTYPPTPSPVLTGMASGSNVYVSVAPTGQTLTGMVASSGKWSIPSQFYTSDLDLQITGSGPALGKPANQPYRDFSFTGFFENSLSGSLQPTAVSPATFRQYGKLPMATERRGRARVTYTMPSGVKKNDTSGQATEIKVQPIRTADAPGRNSIVRSSLASGSGTLWRAETGVREGDYARIRSFPNTFPSDGSLGAPNYGPDVDMTDNAGDTWIDRSLDADVDWLRFAVEDDVVVKLAWTDSDNALATDTWGSRCPLYLDSNANPIQPFRVEAGQAWYWMRNAGTAYTSVELDPSLQNTFGPAGKAPLDRRNPSYSVTATVYRPERVVAIDPLMAARLDKVIDLGGSADHRLRRERFATFQQTSPGRQPRTFVIPRLNLQSLALRTADVALAEAERLFRDDDVIAIDPPATGDDPPTPRFDVAPLPSGAPLRRLSAGRMTWMMLAQPQDPGTAAQNWEAGKMFDVSFVIFQDRKFPALDANAAFEGEYAFSGSWSDATGMLSVTVPFDLDGDSQRDLVTDDVRAIFRSGGWILLAPAVSSDLDAGNTQRLDWIRIRTVELVNEATSTVVQILPEVEPNSDALMRSTQPAGAVVFPVAVLAYEGVVAVVTKPLVLEP